jgi:hypothetical protein
MAKKQTRRSISVSRTTYEKLKSFCETNGISMSQFVENRVGDFLGEAPADSSDAPRPVPAPPAPVRPVQMSQPARPAPVRTLAEQLSPRPVSQSVGTPAGSGAPVAPRPTVTPMTSAAARYAVEPPPPIIKKAEQPAPKAPAMPKANEIFTF